MEIHFRSEEFFRLYVAFHWSLYSTHTSALFPSALGNIGHLCEWGTSCEGGTISCCVGEHSVNHGWLCTGDDMYKAPWFYNFYKIVRKAHFNFDKATKCVSGTSLLLKHYKMHTHTTSWSSSLQYTAVLIHTATCCASLLLLCTLPQIQAFWSLLFHTSLL